MEDGDGVAARCLKHMDTHPLGLNLILIAIALPLVGGLLLIDPLLVATVSRQGLVFAASFVGIRRTCEWVAEWYTAFWYVQQATLSRLEGSRQDAAAAAYLLLGTAAGVGCGLVSMVLLWAAGEPLLRAYSPPYLSNKDALVAIGLVAQSILAVSVLARICTSLLVGIALAQAAKNAFIVLFAYGGAAISLGLGALIMMPILSNSGCEDCISAANATAYERAVAYPMTDEARAGRDSCVAGTPGGQAAYDLAVSAAMGNSTAEVFVQERWVCPRAKSLLELTAVIETVSQFAGVSIIMFCVFYTGYRRGYFAQHGCTIRAYLRDVQELDRNKGSAAAKFTRRNFSVFIRSLTGNSVAFISQIMALRMGLTESAVEQFFRSLGTLSYGVPNITSFGIMVIGGRLLGAGRLAEFRRHVYLHSGWAFASAVVWGGVAAATSSLDLPSSFANAVDYQLFAPLAREVYPMAIALQPFRSLYGVYGPMITGCQGFEEWGALGLFVFLFVYLPIALAGGATGSLATLLAAEASAPRLKLYCLRVFCARETTARLVVLCARKWPVSVRG